jgi:prepilin-type N-terminal cleavage/methylation domain-containing protein
MHSSLQQLCSRREPHESGFTLIELLVVIVVLGVLSAVVIFDLGGVSEKANRAACQADGATLMISIAAFSNLNPGITVTSGLLQGSLDGGPFIQSWPSNSTFAFSLLNGNLMLSSGGATPVSYAGMGSCATSPAAATTSPNLGAAAGTSVSAATTVTSATPTTLSGNLDLYPGTAITGFPAGSVGGTTNLGGSTTGPAGLAASAVATAYSQLTNATPTATQTADLGGLTLSPGVYSSGAGLSITGTVTLVGTANSVFIFKAASTLVTGAGSQVVLSGGVQACHVWWQVGSSATLGASNAFVGNIVAYTSISTGADTSISGSVLALGGAVTLGGGAITTPSCAPVAPGAAGAAKTTISVGSTTTSSNGDSTSTVTVQAKDANGNLLTASGGLVTLATTLGTLSAVTATITGTIAGATITTTSPTLTVAPGAAGAAA